MFASKNPIKSPVLLPVWASNTTGKHLANSYKGQPTRVEKSDGR